MFAAQFLKLKTSYLHNLVRPQDDPQCDRNFFDNRRSKTYCRRATLQESADIPQGLRHCTLEMRWNLFAGRHAVTPYPPRHDRVISINLMETTNG